MQRVFFLSFAGWVTAATAGCDWIYNCGPRGCDDCKDDGSAGYQECCGSHPSPSATSKYVVHGVNYGGIFIPEDFLGLDQTDDLLFKDIQKYNGEDKPTLCDVGTSDREQRMARFMDLNIKEEDFDTIKQQGFNQIRVPLGYWHFVDFPGGSGPQGPSEQAARWRNMRTIMPAASYIPWIDRVFHHAESRGLTVLMDLHSAPGGQSGNECTGCGQPKDEDFYFGTGWNAEYGVKAIEQMATICASKGKTCWGIELLNEPVGAWPWVKQIDRNFLSSFYKDAIKAARKHIPTKPIVIQDWAPQLHHFWKDKQSEFSPAEFGNILFATHLYESHSGSGIDVVKQSYSQDLGFARDFVSSTGRELLVTEYAIAGIGNGKSDDFFPYGELMRWVHQQLSEFSIGSHIWNFKSWGGYPPWGPVVNKCGSAGIPWSDIWSAYPSPQPTPDPSPPTAAPTPAPTSPSGACEDTTTSCRAWAKSDQCTVNPIWMRENCKLSCGVCQPGCVDKSPLCAAWAASNECNANRIWMNENCAKSCNTCSESAEVLV
jgi:hypothetical protein